MRELNAHVLVGAILVLVGILTWLIPAGSYQRQRKMVDNSERTVVVAGTYAPIPASERTPQSPWAWLQAPLKGFVDAAEVIGFVLLVGGAFGVLHATGAIFAALAWLTARTGPRSRIWMIPPLMFAFSLGGATFGMSEESIPFVLVTVPLAVALRLDVITGISIPYVGSHAGFAAAFGNPFTLGIAKGIAEQPLGVGFGYRVLCWFLVTAACTSIVMLHAWRVSRDPSRSPTPELDESWRRELTEQPAFSAQMTGRHWAVLTTFLIAIASLGFCASMIEGFSIGDMTSLFLGTAILVAILGGIAPGATAQAFVRGVRDMCGAAVLIAMARGILVVARDGQIIDPVLDAGAGALQGLGPTFAAQAMFVAQSVINFFVPSGSGQAALTMPIMAPLADLVPMHRELAILAYQFGDGFTNMIIPTSPVLMGVLSAARLDFVTWLRWVLKMQVVLFLLGFALLAAAPF